MAPRSRIRAWRIPWTEEPGGLQSWGREELDTTEHRQEDTAQKRAKVKAKVKATGLLPRTSSRSAQATFRLRIAQARPRGRRVPGGLAHLATAGARGTGPTKQSRAGPAGPPGRQADRGRVRGGCS